MVYPRLLSSGGPIFIEIEDTCVSYKIQMETEAGATYSYKAFLGSKKIVIDKMFGIKLS